jgi:hypothetical protein
MMNDERGMMNGVLGGRWVLEVDGVVFRRVENLDNYTRYG